ncbi:hypothetical protein [Kitasatospora sp. NPDC059327]|uniref:hypothetical protein n=1 Tax=Kitasatospora sp. NPDC059327 TaxID=3346803 RepID=UPI00369E0CF4
MSVSVMSEPTAPSGYRAPTRRVLRGAVWVSVRQERTPLLIAGAVLLLLCGWMLFLGSQIQGFVEDHGIQGCNVVYFPPECEALSDQAIVLAERWGTAVQATGWLLVVLPVAFGVFFAAPMLAREFETGTYALAWTQSVSRLRWLATRLGVPLALTLVGSVLLAVVSTWWTGVVEGRFSVAGYYHWFTWMSRTTSGPSVVGFCLLSVALGAAVGLVLRRVVASIVVTAVLTLAVRFAVDAGRYLFAPARETFAALTMAGPRPAGRPYTGPGGPPVDPTQVITTGHLPTSTPLESHVVENGLLTSDGLRIPLDGDWLGRYSDGSVECPTSECAAHQDTIVQAYASYHPPAQEWAMHWAQTGLSLAVTVVLVVFCAVWVRRMR